MSGVVISLDLLPPRTPPAQSMADHLRPALEKFVNALHRDILARDARQSETQEWVEKIFAGTSRNTVALTLLNSEERRRHTVRQYHQRFLQREPNAQDLTMWTDFLAAGKGHEDLIATLLGGDPLAPRPNDAFLKSLFTQLYHRHANPTEISSWMGLLGSGTATQQSIAHTFVTSREFREATIRRWHLELLHHEPDAAGLVYWLDQMEQGTSFEKILAGVLSNNEYFSQALLADGLPIRPVS